MRATISIDEELWRAARERAAAEGVSLSAFIVRALREVLYRAPDAAEPPPFHLIVVGGGGPKEGIDLDKTSALLAAEDVATYRPRGD
jgi:hypothetical protein